MQSGGFYNGKPYINLDISCNFLTFHEIEASFLDNILFR